MIIFRVLCVTLCFASWVSSAGAVPSVRPVAGKGVLIIPAAAASRQAMIYEFPGVRRKEPVVPAELPSLSRSVAVKTEDAVVAFFAVRSGYARVAVHASGEEGWLELRPGWQFVPWERFLKGRAVRLTPGTREQAARLREIPAESGAVTGTASIGERLTVSEAYDDWVRVQREGAIPGWLRWRDGDGRMLVSVE